ncbi:MULTISPECIES: hypothetical protein [Natrialbaceae]|jgi:hypothetical protein|uniref:Uncharacterized protein n=2 Tax=Natrialbaceae TaxID=1644061 RepID=M0A1C8_NATA2|nr:MULTISPECIES: hypothetical protein [Natrialbaceae]ELY42720.1 hypothetical protein C496_05267 [Natronorubrum tibetense GA33]ELY92126.1 hypothetical protein C485_00095 [Natrinema altunense JCM 12890]
MPNLNIEVDQDEYDRLSEIKDAHGLTWKGVLLQGAKSLDTEGPL